MQDNTNTTFGWILFSGIVALGLSIGAGMYFHADSPEPPEEGGMKIEGGEEGGGEAAGPSLATLLASGDAAAGEKLFAKCMACHTAEQGGANGIGPNLFGVVGKPIGQHVAGFAYSTALSGHGGDWSYENLDEWLKSPRGFANGTKMSFAGMSGAEDRANVILYLVQNGGGPALPTPEAPAAEAPAEGADAAADAGAEAAPAQDAAAAE